MKKYKIKVGITGYKGVLGSEFIKLYKKKYNLIIFKNDIRNKNEVNKWIKENRPDAIIHLAAKVEVDYVNKNRKVANDVNYIGTINLINSIKSNKLDTWFFFASSSHVYQFSNKKLSESSNTLPITFYGKLKLKTERYLLKQKKLNICIGRIFSFTHHKQNRTYFVPSMYEKIKQNKNINLNLIKNQYRDFLSVKDICNAIQLLLDLKFKGIINICSSNPVNLFTIVSILTKTLKKKVNRVQKSINYRLSLNYLVGNNKKLKNLGFKVKSSINTILKNYVNKSS